MKGFGSKGADLQWQRCVLMKANDRVLAPEGKATHGFYWSGQPSRANLVASEARRSQNRATALGIWGISAEGSMRRAAKEWRRNL
jgi:hypothetical protein